MQNPQVMFTNYTKASILLCLFLILASCVEDGLIEETPRVITPEPQEIIDVTLYGRVLSPTGAPVVDAEVSYLTGLKPQLTTTDSDGYFLFNAVRNKGRSAFISVRSGDYFEAFRRYSVLPGRYNYTELRMANRTIIGTIQSDTGGTLTQEDGASITLPANGIITIEGNRYQGPVEVAMNWINPTSETLSSEMIGDLSGIDEEGTLRALTTYGMLQVELIGSNGQLLNLGEGYESQLTFPLPSTLVAQATPSIPLWSYNEQKGIWIQEGIAIKEEGTYVGSVSHFTSWNVDHMTDPIDITGFVKFEIAEEIASAGYLRVNVCSDNIGTKGGWLCEDGSFRFYNFPKDEIFKIQLYDHCGNKIYQETYGPYSTDTEIDPIVVSNTSNIIRVVGNAITCGEEAVTNAKLSVRLANRNLDFPVKEDGTFDFTIDVCDTRPLVLTIIDLDVLLEKSITISGENEEVILENVKVCDKLEEYIIIITDSLPNHVFISNFNVTHVDYQDSIASTAIIAEQEDSISTIVFQLLIRNPDTLPSMNSILAIYYSNDDDNCSPFFEDRDNDNDKINEIPVKITSFGTNIGDIIEGTFKGLYQCQISLTGREYTNKVSGSFRVRRNG